MPVVRPCEVSYHLARLLVLWHHLIMAAIDETKKPKKGRPPVESEAINLRLVKDVLVALDAFRKDEHDLPNRPEGVRRLLMQALRERGYLPK